MSAKVNLRAHRAFGRLITSTVLGSMIITLLQ